MHWYETSMIWYHIVSYHIKQYQYTENVVLFMVSKVPLFSLEWMIWFCEVCFWCLNEIWFKDIFFSISAHLRNVIKKEKGRGKFLGPTFCSPHQSPPSSFPRLFSPLLPQIRERKGCSAFSPSIINALNQYETFTKLNCLDDAGYSKQFSLVPIHTGSGTNLYQDHEPFGLWSVWCHTN